MGSPQAWIEDYASVSVNIQPVVPSSQAFGRAVYLADVALDGTERWRIYTGTTTLAADLAAGEINADVQAAVIAAFAQRPAPSDVAVVRADLDNSEGGGAETYAEALTAARDLGLQWFYISSESEAAADHVAIDGWIGSAPYMQIFHSSDGDWLTSSVPAGYSTITSSIVSMPIYHATASEHASFAEAARMSGVNVDVQSPSFRGPLVGLTQYVLTATQFGLALANECNVLQPLMFGGTDNDLGRGTVMSGEEASAVLTKFWTEVRIKEDIASQIVKYEAVSRKFPLNDRGVAIVEAMLTKRGEIGLRAEHYTKRADLPRGYDFSATIDVPTKTITVSGEYGLLDGVRTFSFTFDLTREA